MTKVIVHISGDFPDDLQPRKTKAVSSLVDAINETFDQRVYSINRAMPSASAILKEAVRRPVSPQHKISLNHAETGVSTVRYEALPAGIFLSSSLSRLADEIANDLTLQGIQPDLIHAHKLTIEGLIAEKIGKRLNCPFALSIQVNTDRKILKYRPDLLRTFRRVYHNAAVVFPFSVMGQRVCDQLLGTRKKPTIVLPCTSDEDKLIYPRVCEPVLASVFHLKDHANKNVSALIKASSTLKARHASHEFHLYGGGESHHEKLIDDLVARNRATAFLRKGSIPHSEVQQMLNGMCGFAMVSKRETFGMVFLEAILAGCPVVYPRDWAIDGFFDDASFALSAAADDLEEITGSMEKLIVDQTVLKKELAKWQESGRLSCFQRSKVVATYKDAIRSVISSEGNRLNT